MQQRGGRYCQQCTALLLLQQLHQFLVPSDNMGAHCCEAHCAIVAQLAAPVQLHTISSWRHVPALRQVMNRTLSCHCDNWQTQCNREIQPW